VLGRCRQEAAKLYPHRRNRTPYCLRSIGVSSTRLYYYHSILLVTHSDWHTKMKSASIGPTGKTTKFTAFPSTAATISHFCQALPDKGKSTESWASTTNVKEVRLNPIQHTNFNFQNKLNAQTTMVAANISAFLANTEQPASVQTTAMRSASRISKSTYYLVTN
jgi:hypothetical protein